MIHSDVNQETDLAMFDGLYENHIVFQSVCLSAYPVCTTAPKLMKVYL